MPQFAAGPAATSNPFCVNGKEFLSRNREMLGDMIACPPRVYRRRGRHCPILILPALATRKSGNRGGY